MAWCSWPSVTIDAKEVRDAKETIFCCRLFPDGDVLRWSDALSRRIVRDREILALARPGGWNVERGRNAGDRGDDGAAPRESRNR